MASESRPPSEKELNTYGAMFAASTFGISILSASLLVFQIVLVLYGISGFFATPKDRRRRRLRFIIISAVMLVMCAIDTGLDLRREFRYLYTGGPDGVSYLQAMRIVYANDSRLWDSIGDAFLYVAIAVGDVLMLWRCLILWTDRKWVVLFPSLICLGSIGSNIACLVGVASFDDNIGYKGLLAGAGLNVILNVMITFLIVLRVLRARSRTAKAFPNQKPPRWYSGVTALVVESAAPLSIFGICFIALRAVNVSETARGLQSGRVLQRGRHNITTGVFTCLYYAFCTPSPQIIIVRVTRGKAWTHSTVVEDTDEGAKLSQPIQFAHSAGSTTASNISDSV
ncbi:hypothetical protein BKA70DRAFT_1185512 [Coprinopsis sp. MPI-PUGE-AT-0042]|nr:hypothetical protein BKA70DRAFT_1185512 [Coprinopsis sp. MPI-PUGE-AT-0042]